MEAGGLNLYGFCRNNSINFWDILGMAPSHSSDTGDTFEEEFPDDNGVLKISWYCNGGTDWYRTQTVYVLNGVKVTPGANDENVAPPIDAFGLLGGGGNENGLRNREGLTFREGASAFISGLGEGAYDVAMAFRVLPEALGGLAGAAIVDFRGTVSGVHDTLTTNIANGIILASETSLADIRRDIVAAGELYLNDRSSRQAVTSWLAGTGTTIGLGGAISNTSLAVSPSEASAIRYFAAQGLQWWDDGIGFRLPNPSRATPPEPPPAITIIAERQPPAGAGPDPLN